MPTLQVSVGLGQGHMQACARQHLGRHQPGRPRPDDERPDGLRASPSTGCLRHAHALTSLRAGSGTPHDGSPTPGAALAVSAGTDRRRRGGGIGRDGGPTGYGFAALRTPGRSVGQGTHRPLTLPASAPRRGEPRVSSTPGRTRRPCHPSSRSNVLPLVPAPTRR